MKKQLKLAAWLLVLAMILSCGAMATATLTVTASTTAVAIGETANFTATVTGGSGNYTYKWEISKDGGSTWAGTSATGSTTKTLSIKLSDTNKNYKFRCTATDKSDTSVKGTSAGIAPIVKSATVTTTNKSGTVEYKDGVIKAGKASNIADGGQYFVLVVQGKETEFNSNWTSNLNNVLYVDQVVGGKDGKISFNVNPKELGTCTIWLCGTYANGKTTQVLIGYVTVSN